MSIARFIGFVLIWKLVADQMLPIIYRLKTLSNETTSFHRERKRDKQLTNNNRKKNREINFNISSQIEIEKR